ncbi:unnamed protein product, partial [Mesorhabditis spiculigera]
MREAGSIDDALIIVGSLTLLLGSFGLVICHISRKRCCRKDEEAGITPSAQQAQLPETPQSPDASPAPINSGEVISGSQERETPAATPTGKQAGGSQPSSAEADQDPQRRVIEALKAEHKSQRNVKKQTKKPKERTKDRATLVTADSRSRTCDVGGMTTQEATRDHSKHSKHSKLNAISKSRSRKGGKTVTEKTMVSKRKPRARLGNKLDLLAEQERFIDDMTTTVA